MPPPGPGADSGQPETLAAMLRGFLPRSGLWGALAAGLPGWRRHLASFVAYRIQLPRECELDHRARRAILLAVGDDCEAHAARPGCGFSATEQRIGVRCVRGTGACHSTT